MLFSRKEIVLAKQLKEKGLVWKPEVGDWYLDGEGDVELLTPVGCNMWNEYESLPIKNRIWLPLWHQCRELLIEAGWRHFQLIHNVGCQDGKISVSAERGKRLLRALGETDLEAMYQVVRLQLEVNNVSCFELDL